MKQEFRILNCELRINESGNAWVGILIMLVLILGLGLSLVTEITASITQSKKAEQVQVVQSLCDAGIEKAVWKLNQPGGGTYSGENNINLGTGVLDISVANIDSNNKKVTTSCYVPNKTNPSQTRTLEAKLTAESNSETVAFNFGVQVGALGITMSNNAIINGNVYGQGTLEGANNALVFGDVIMSGATGKIEETKICTKQASSNNCDTSKKERTAKAHTITGSDIYGDAYYKTISETTVRRNSYPNSQDPQNIDLPITDAMVSEWEGSAAAGGTYIGNYVLTNFATASLGPKKIQGDLNISNGAQLTLTGVLWVTGNVNISNNAVIKLDPSFGQNSSMIIADNPGNQSTYGKINVSNNTMICGSYSLSDCLNGTPPNGNKSYMMLFSTNTGSSTGNPAINAANNSKAVVYYTKTGMLEIANNANVKAITGGGLHLSNGAQVNYDTGLASAEFSTGPGGSWVVKEWKIVY